MTGKCLYMVFIINIFINLFHTVFLNVDTIYFYDTLMITAKDLTTELFKETENA